MRRVFACALALSILASGVEAAPACRDKGKFVKCPPPAAPPAARCKDAKGKFTKCPAAGAKPA